MMHQSGPQHDVQDESTDSTYWYVQTDAGQMGPYFFSRLRQMAHHGKIRPEDRVRRGKTGDWRPAADVSGLEFPNSPQQVEVSANVVAEPVVVPQKQGPSLLSSLVTSVRDRIEGIFDNVRQLILDRLNDFRRLASWIALAGISIAFVVVVAKQLPLGWFMTGHPLRIYTSIWDELKEKRNAKATAAEWDAFATKARAQIAPTVVKLERIASARDRGSQQLLWAGRDYLPKMLDDARTEESLSEIKFAEHMQRATWLHQGKDLNGRRPFQNGPSDPFGFNTDMLTTVLGVLFVIFDVAIIIWFVKGRRSAKSAV